MDNLLKSFMQEQFDFEGLLEIGFFKEEMRNDYEAQAAKVCHFFGFDSVYEYGANERRCHFSYAEEWENPEDDMGGRPLHVNEKGELKKEPFITVIPSIYD